MNDEILKEINGKLDLIYKATKAIEQLRSDIAMAQSIKFDSDIEINLTYLPNKSRDEMIPYLIQNFDNLIKETKSEVHKLVDTPFKSEPLSKHEPKEFKR